MGLCISLFYVREHPKTQPAVVLVLKCLRRRGHDLVLFDRLGEPGIELRTPGYNASDLSTTSLQLSLTCKELAIDMSYRYLTSIEYT